MGQSHPTTRRENKVSTVISNQQEKLRFMEEINVTAMDQEEHSECCNVLWGAGSSNKKTKEQWKKRMIDELNALTLSVWPQILINVLKKSNTANVDQVYQTDLVWFDNTYENKPLESDSGHYKFFEIGKLNFVEQSPKNQAQDPSTNDEKGEKHDRFGTQASLEKEKFDLDQAFKNILAYSEIPAEQIFAVSGKESWLDKSFDIKISSEYSQPIPSYFDQIPPYSLVETNKKLGGDRRSSSLFSTGQDNSRRMIDTYNNNTVLNQHPVTNRTSTKTVGEANEIYQSILKYKAATNIIEKHLSQQNNIFRQLINLFESYFVNTYSKACGNNPVSDYKILSDFDSHAITATLDLQQFIRILYEGINLYYRLKTLRIGRLPDNETLFNRDNMINFVTSIVFTPEVYNIIFSLYQQQDKEIEQAFQKNVKLCQNLAPEDFTVPPAFCLNEKTIRFFKEKKESTRKERSILIEEAIKWNAVPEEKKEDEEEEHSQLEKSISLLQTKELVLQFEGSSSSHRVFPTPYQSAIAALPDLKLCRSPIHKVKTILKMIELISASIEEFYKENGLSNSKKLDGDHTLAICLYVVAKSGLENIKSHCKLIERFSTTNILNSISGYYATTLEACVDCICTMDLQQNASKNDVSINIKQRIQSFDMTSF